MRSEPRRWYDQRFAAQMARYPELQWGTPRMVAQVDGLRSDEGRLPSRLTQDTTRLAANIVRDKRRQITPFPTAPAPASTGSAGLARDQGPSFFGSVKGLLSAVDRPISERLGLRIPDAPGPFDEILNIGLEEATRPTNWAAALAGGPVAAGIVRAGRGTRLAKPALFASKLAEPFAQGRGPGARLAAETAVVGAGRAAAEGSQEALPEGAPTWARVGLGLGAGVAGGVGAARLLPSALSSIPGSGFRGATEAADPSAISPLRSEVDPISYDLEESWMPDSIRNVLGDASVSDESRGKLSFFVERGLKPPEPGLEIPSSITQIFADERNIREARSSLIREQAKGVLQNSSLKFDSQWRVPSLKGKDPSLKGPDGEDLAPTITDVAARFPTYYRFLTPDQREDIKELGALADYSFTALKDSRAIGREAGMSKAATEEIGSRFDVEVFDSEINESGIYFPRGVSDKSGGFSAELPRPRRGGRAKKGFENPGKYPSQSFGLAVGEAYDSPFDAIGGHVRDQSEQIASNVAAIRLLKMEGINNKRVARSREDRYGDEYPELKEKFEVARKRANLARAQIHRLIAQEPVVVADAGRLENNMFRLLELDQKAAAAREGEMSPEALARLEKDTVKLLKSQISQSQKFFKKAGRRNARIGDRVTKEERLVIDRDLKQADLDAKLTEAEELQGELEAGKRTKTQLEAARAATRRMQKSVNVLARKIEDSEDRIAGMRRDTYSEGMRSVKGRSGLPRVGPIDDDYLEAPSLGRTPSGSPRDAEFGIEDEELIKTAMQLNRSGTQGAVQAMQFASDTRAKIAALDAATNFFAREFNRAEKASIAGSARAAKLLTKLEKARENFARAEEEIDRLRPEVNRAQKEVAGPPPGEASVLIDGLEPYSFPEDIALEVAKYVKGPQAPPLGVLGQVNSFMRGLQATGEMSYLGIQLAPAIGADPRIGMPAARMSLEAWMNSGDEVMPAFISSFDKNAAKGFIGPDGVFRPKRSVDGWIDAGTQFAGGKEELTLAGSVPEKLKEYGDVAPAITGPLVELTKRADRGYRVAGNSVRMGWASAMEDLWLLENPGRGGIPDDVAKKIGETANRMSGWTPQRAFGDWGEALLFAPRYLAARARALGQLASTDPFKRKLARKVMGKFIVNATMATFAANYLLGNDEEGTVFGTDIRPFSGKNGPTSNPLEAEYKNPNFMRITDVAGRDWSLLAGMDALLGLQIGLTSLVTNPTGDPSEITGRTRQLLSAPMVSAGIDWMIDKENFDGDELKLDTRAGQMDILRRFVPFAVPDLAEAAVDARRTAQTGDVGGTAAEVAGGVAQGFFGGRGTRATTREQVERGDTAGFTPGEQFEAIKPRAWNRTKKWPGMDDIGRYTNFGQWYDAEEKKLVRKLKRRYRGRRPEAEIYEKAAKEIRDSRVYTRYMEERRRLSDLWVRTHPQEALNQWSKSVTDTGFDRWNPSSAQKNRMSSYARRTGQLAR